MAKTKKGPLSKADMYYIEGHCKDIAVSKIAEDLNRSISSVQTYIDKNIKPKTAAINSGEQFIRQSGATIMTENASTIADETKSSGLNAPRKKNCITKIK
tara:strand:+ start:165 stop:464 length:300 start_codon:yes stop_codon:yes gene_type:complete